MAGLLHELQEENAQSIAYLGGVQVNQPRLELQYSRTDAAAERLNDPELALSQEVQGANALTGISLLRQRVSEQRITLGDADQSYRQMRTAVLEDLSRVAKTRPDPETKDRLYSHLSLLNSTDALANVRTSLAAASPGWLPAGDLGWLYDQLARYSTSLFLFERCPGRSARRVPRKITRDRT
ncbi:MAG: nitrate- and nitrite sensing domain-containing protein [Flavobacteriales bacterium]|nr:nitrate- and nitrite sensing domain-containing protein [Flavobacteriales bacterium]